MKRTKRVVKIVVLALAVGPTTTMTPACTDFTVTVVTWALLPLQILWELRALTLASIVAAGAGAGHALRALWTTARITPRAPPHTQG
jgi:hypothetical protein